MVEKDNPNRTDIRGAILDAADRLVRKHGYGKTTVDDIARDAGIGKGTVYLYFRSKEDVALSCSDRLNRRLQERLRAIAASGAHPVHKVRHILVERVLYRFDNAHGHGRALDELYAALRPQLLARRRGHHEAEAEILAEVFLEGRGAGVFDVPEALPAARAVILATNALMPYSLTAEQLGAREDIEAMARRIADLLLYGIVPRGEGAAQTASNASYL